MVPQCDGSTLCRIGCKSVLGHTVLKLARIFVDISDDGLAVLEGHAPRAVGIEYVRRVQRVGRGEVPGQILAVRSDEGVGAFLNALGYNQREGTVGNTLVVGRPAGTGGTKDLDAVQLLLGIGIGDEYYFVDG